MRSTLSTLLLVLMLGQVAFLPYAAPETCDMLEQQGRTPDCCAPLCATCSCCTTAHVFVGVQARTFTSRLAEVPFFGPSTDSALTGTSREVLHVPLT